MKNIVRYFHQSLSLKLSIGVLLMTALIFFATLGIVFVESRRNIRQESIEHAASVLNNVAQNISCAEYQSLSQYRRDSHKC